MFDIQPENQILIPNQSVLFHCKYSLDFQSSNSSGEIIQDIRNKENVDTRIEWRKDGAFINHIRSNRRM